MSQSAQSFGVPNSPYNPNSSQSFSTPSSPRSRSNSENGTNEILNDTWFVKVDIPTRSNAEAVFETYLSSGNRSIQEIRVATETVKKLEQEIDNGEIANITNEILKDNLKDTDAFKTVKEFCACVSQMIAHLPNSNKFDEFNNFFEAYANSANKFFWMQKNIKGFVDSVQNNLDDILARYILDGDQKRKAAFKKIQIAKGFDIQSVSNDQMMLRNLNFNPDSDAEMGDNEFDGQFADGKFVEKIQKIIEKFGDNSLEASTLRSRFRFYKQLAYRFDATFANLHIDEFKLQFAEFWGTMIKELHEAIRERKAIDCTFVDNEVKADFSLGDEVNGVRQIDETIAEGVLTNICKEDLSKLKLFDPTLKDDFINYLIYSCDNFNGFNKEHAFYLWTHRIKQKCKSLNISEPQFWTEKELFYLKEEGLSSYEIMVARDIIENIDQLNNLSSKYAIKELPKSKWDIDTLLRKMFIPKDRLEKIRQYCILEISKKEISKIKNSTKDSVEDRTGEKDFLAHLSENIDKVFINGSYIKLIVDAIAEAIIQKAQDLSEGSERGDNQFSESSMLSAINYAKVMAALCDIKFWDELNNERNNTEGRNMFFHVYQALLMSLFPKNKESVRKILEQDNENGLFTYHGKIYKHAKNIIENKNTACEKFTNKDKINDLRLGVIANNTTVANVTLKCFDDWLGCLLSVSSDTIKQLNLTIKQKQFVCKAMSEEKFYEYVKNLPAELKILVLNYKASKLPSNKESETYKNLKCDCSIVLGEFCLMQENDWNKFKDKVVGLAKSLEIFDDGAEENIQKKLILEAAYENKNKDLIAKYEGFNEGDFWNGQKQYITELIKDNYTNIKLLKSGINGLKMKAEDLKYFVEFFADLENSNELSGTRGSNDRLNKVNEIKNVLIEKAVDVISRTIVKSEDQINEVKLLLQGKVDIKKLENGEFRFCIESKFDQVQDARLYAYVNYCIFFKLGLSQKQTGDIFKSVDLSDDEKTANMNRFLTAADMRHWRIDQLYFRKFVSDCLPEDESKKIDMQRFVAKKIVDNINQCGIDWIKAGNIGDVSVTEGVKYGYFEASKENKKQLGLADFFENKEEQDYILQMLVIYNFYLSEKELYEPNLEKGINNFFNSYTDDNDKMKFITERNKFIFLNLIGYIKHGRKRASDIVIWKVEKNKRGQDVIDKEKFDSKDFKYKAMRYRLCYVCSYQDGKRDKDVMDVLTKVTFEKGNSNVIKANLSKDDLSTINTPDKQIALYKALNEMSMSRYVGKHLEKPTNIKELIQLTAVKIVNFKELQDVLNPIDYKLKNELINGICDLYYNLKKQLDSNAVMFVDEEREIANLVNVLAEGTNSNFYTAYSDSSDLCLKFCAAVFVGRQNVSSFNSMYTVLDNYKSNMFQQRDVSQEKVSNYTHLLGEGENDKFIEGEALIARTLLDDKSLEAISCDVANLNSNPDVEIQCFRSKDMQGLINALNSVERCDSKNAMCAYLADLLFKCELNESGSSLKAEDFIKAWKEVDPKSFEKNRGLIVYYIKGFMTIHRQDMIDQNQNEGIEQKTKNLMSCLQKHFIEIKPVEFDDSKFKEEMPYKSCDEIIKEFIFNLQERVYNSVVLKMNFNSPNDTNDTSAIDREKYNNLSNLIAECERKITELNAFLKRKKEDDGEFAKYVDMQTGRIQNYLSKLQSCFGIEALNDFANGYKSENDVFEQNYVKPLKDIAFDDSEKNKAEQFAIQSKKAIYSRCFLEFLNDQGIPVSENIKNGMVLNYIALNLASQGLLNKPELDIFNFRRLSSRLFAITKKLVDCETYSCARIYRDLYDVCEKNLGYIISKNENMSEGQLKESINKLMDYYLAGGDLILESPENREAKYCRFKELDSLADLGSKKLEKIKFILGKQLSVNIDLANGSNIIWHRKNDQDVVTKGDADYLAMTELIIASENIKSTEEFDDLLRILGIPFGTLDRFWNWFYRNRDEENIRKDDWKLKLYKKRRKIEEAQEKVLQEGAKLKETAKKNYACKTSLKPGTDAASENYLTAMYSIYNDDVMREVRELIKGLVDAYYWDIDKKMRENIYFAVFAFLPFGVEDWGFPANSDEFKKLDQKELKGKAELCMCQMNDKAKLFKKIYVNFGFEFNKDDAEEFANLFDEFITKFSSNCQPRQKDYSVQGFFIKRYGAIGESLAKSIECAIDTKNKKIIPYLIFNSLIEWYKSKRYYDLKRNYNMNYERFSYKIFDFFGEIAFAFYPHCNFLFKIDKEMIDKYLGKTFNMDEQNKNGFIDTSDRIHFNNLDFLHMLVCVANSEKLSKEELNSEIENEIKEKEKIVARMTSDCKPSSSSSENLTSRHTLSTTKNATLNELISTKIKETTLIMLNMNNRFGKDSISDLTMVNDKFHKNTSFSDMVRDFIFELEKASDTRTIYQLIFSTFNIGFGAFKYNMQAMSKEQGKELNGKCNGAPTILDLYEVLYYYYYRLNNLLKTNDQIDLHEFFDCDGDQHVFLSKKETQKLFENMKNAINVLDEWVPSIVSYKANYSRYIVNTSWNAAEEKYYSRDKFKLPKEILGECNQRDFLAILKVRDAIKSMISKLGLDYDAFVKQVGGEANELYIYKMLMQLDEEEIKVSGVVRKKLMNMRLEVDGNAGNMDREALIYNKHFSKFGAIIAVCLEKLNKNDINLGNKEKKQSMLLDINKLSCRISYDTNVKDRTTNNITNVSLADYISKFGLKDLPIDLDEKYKDIIIANAKTMCEISLELSKDDEQPVIRFATEIYLRELLNKQLKKFVHEERKKGNQIDERFVTVDQKIELIKQIPEEEKQKLNQLLEYEMKVNFISKRYGTNISIDFFGKDFKDEFKKFVSTINVSVCGDDVVKLPVKTLNQETIETIEELINTNFTTNNNEQHPTGQPSTEKNSTDDFAQNCFNAWVQYRPVFQEEYSIKNAEGNEETVTNEDRRVIRSIIANRNLSDEKIKDGNDELSRLKSFLKTNFSTSNEDYSSENVQENLKLLFVSYFNFVFAPLLKYLTEQVLLNCMKFVVDYLTTMATLQSAWIFVAWRQKKAYTAVMNKVSDEIVKAAQRVDLENQPRRSSNARWSA